MRPSLLTRVLRLSRLWRPIALCGLFAAVITQAPAQNQSHLFINYDAEAGTATYLNPLIGTDMFYSAGYLGSNTIVANVEAGHIWYDHDSFDRPAEATNPLFTFSNTASLNEVDYHATMVGQTMAGTGYVPASDPAQYYFVGIGVAPYAGMWSGAIATEFSATNLGEFNTTYESTITPYKAFFNGINGERPDVINSSWGGQDPAATAPESVAIDGLAKQNSTVAFVVSAGNGGTETVAGPGSGYNNITVGSVGGASLLDPSAFSSHGPADFYNPATDQTLTGVRAAVDIAAPGEKLVLAAYLGDSGSIGASTDPEIQGIIQTPPATDLYFLEMDGTSFSAPIVSGGIALLKDVAKSPAYSAEMGEEALDTRVIKSVIMASATETNGWNNGQTENEDGVVVTTQALDYATGAGALNLENAATVYVFGTTDVDGTTGGTIESEGWDLGQLGIGLSNEYLFDTSFLEPTELTISLNWFADRSFDNETDVGEDLSFADVNLQVWFYTEGSEPLLVAESISLYNNAEFLRLTLTDPGQYGITVDFDGMVYDLTSGVTSESYGLAWQASTVPEPSVSALLVLSLALLRRKRRS